MTTPETIRYYTPKLGLLAPALDDDVSAARDNWQKLDDMYAGALWVTAGTTPDSSRLFPGAIVAERGTGIVWRAQRNIAGGYDKKYLNYPYMISLAQETTWPNGNGPAGGGDWGYDVVESGVNAQLSDLVNFRFVIPVTGIWVGTDTIKWKDTGSNQGGLRAHSLRVNGDNDNNWDEEIVKAISFVNGVAFTQVPINRKFTKGDTICGYVWSDSGGSQMTNHRLQLTLAQAS